MNSRKLVIWPETDVSSELPLTSFDLGLAAVRLISTNVRHNN